MTKIFRYPIWLFISFIFLTACGGSKPEGIIVTFRVADREEYKIQLTDSADIEIARKLFIGEEDPKIPNGKVVFGDGLPSDVEQGIITSDYYCPWSAEVIAIDE